MKVLVIIGHQKQGSFCHAIAQAAIEELRALGHEVIFHDLYAEGFDPILPDAEIPRDAAPGPVVRRHCDEVTAADGFWLAGYIFLGAALIHQYHLVYRPARAREIRAVIAIAAAALGLLLGGLVLEGRDLFCHRIGHIVIGRYEGSSFVRAQNPSSLLCHEA